jgi:branched-chain amino acid transport system ATP-binding protein
MMLQVRDIHTYYGDSYVLQGISLEVPEGSVVSVLGRNGMGKTTLIRSVVGFTPPRQGRIIFQDQDITHRPSYDIIRMGMGLVPQGRRIFPSLSVVENLTVAARQAAAPPGDGEAWTVERIYQLFPRLAERKGHRGNKLSGGEQQMLAIARALMGNPEFLLMDEPSEGLAPLLVRGLADTLKQLKGRGLSILLVEQNLHFALGVADRVHVLSKGKIVYSAAPIELQRNEEVKHQYLGV